MFPISTLFQRLPMFSSKLFPLPIKISRPVNVRKGKLLTSILTSPTTDMILYIQTFLFVNTLSIDIS